MRHTRRESFWQSFADLAMGTMAVIILVLLLVLFQQTEADRSYRDDLRKALQEGQAAMGQQDRIAQLLQEIFQESDCPLSFDEKTGELRTGATGDAANLYDPGEVTLSREGQEALRRCGLNFLTLVVCFDKRSAAGQLCGELLHTLEPGQASRRLAQFRELKGQVEAMILQGNTDRTPYPGARSVPGVSSSSYAGDFRAHVEFVSNTYLGAERARQALGVLSQVIAAAAKAQKVDGSTLDPLDALFGLISVESSAFGNYLAGPPKDRLPGCEVTKGGDCAAARNLSLRLRWAEEELRRPFEALVDFYCEQRSQQDRVHETKSGYRVDCSRSLKDGSR